MNKLNYTEKAKDPFSFEIWMFRNSQPDRDICVAMTST